MLYGTLARQIEKLAPYLARWLAKLKHWHAVGTLARLLTLARKNENLAHFWHAGTQARWHIDHVSTQARMARDLPNLENSSITFFFQFYLFFYLILISFILSTLFVILLSF